MVDVHFDARYVNEGMTVQNLEDMMNANALQLPVTMML